MSPEELALIEGYLADLRAATVRYGQEAFRRQDAAEARRHADRLDELARADGARLALVEAIEALRRALAAFPPLPAEETPTPPPALAPGRGPDLVDRASPTATLLASDLEGEPIQLTDGARRAFGVYKDGVWIVRAGSEARTTVSPSLVGGYRTLREALVRDGTLVQVNAETLRFERDVVFTSPSAAGAVVLGRSSNGRLDWRRPDGRTLHGADARSSG